MELAGICLAEVRLGKKTGFSCAGAAADQRVQVAPVLAAVQTNGHILRQNFVLRGVGVGVFPVNLRRLAPLGRAVFLPPAVIALGGEVDADGQRIAQRTVHHLQQFVNGFLQQLDIFPVGRRIYKAFDVGDQGHLIHVVIDLLQIAEH